MIAMQITELPASTIEVNGILDERTIRALQQWLYALGLYTGELDGLINMNGYSDTVAALQRLVTGRFVILSDERVMSNA